MMKKITVLISLILVALSFTSCGEQWELEQELKTRAGSIATVDPYLAECEVDGMIMSNPVNAQGLVFLDIIMEDSNHISIDVNTAGYGITPWILVNDGNYSHLYASGVLLGGSAGDVTFSSGSMLALSRSDLSSSEFSGTVSGWLKNITLLQTRLSRDKYEMDGEVVIKWQDYESRKDHIMKISRIQRYLDKK